MRRARHPKPRCAPPTGQHGSRSRDGPRRTLGMALARAALGNSNSGTRSARGRGRPTTCVQATPCLCAVLRYVRCRVGPCDIWTGLSCHTRRDRWMRDADAACCMFGSPTPVTKTSLRDTPIYLILWVPFLAIGWELCVPAKTPAVRHSSLRGKCHTIGWGRPMFSKI